MTRYNEKKLTRYFNFTFCYIDYDRSLNYSRFRDFVDCIYPIELKLKNATDTAWSASYLHLHFETDGEDL